MASSRSMTKLVQSGSASGYISRRHGSVDPELDPDPHQYVRNTVRKKDLSSDIKEVSFMKAVK
jgi:hypothetical protein